MELARAIATEIDRIAAFALWPLAIWILLSGLDDLFICGSFLYLRLNRARLLPAPPDFQTPEAEGGADGRARPRRVAIYVPLWKEDGVIRGMLEHNLAAIDYPNYDFFVGAYPNDLPTVRAVQIMASRSLRVHLALCPHDGPTSKADCLNWIYQRMLLFERDHGVNFDLVLTHDAEDLIHPLELRTLDHYAGLGYGMVQTPVLPLPTKVREWTHGLYCDDFAEFHLKDLPVRWLLGGFIPSSGVGTAFSREALEALAQSDSNLIFRPDCLTEDYENGYRVHKLGYRQIFVPIQLDAGRAGNAPQPIATREYFPKGFQAAKRQRTRWITGITLQGWARNRWGGGGREAYWFWRDRKGLAGNPASLAANILFVYGLLTWAYAFVSGTGWGLGARMDAAAVLILLPATATVGVLLASARAWCSAEIYGWRFAVWSPLRSLSGNLLNSLATFGALKRYFAALWFRQPLVWLKTEHAYPNLGALESYKQPLEAVLTGMGILSPASLAEAVAQASGRPLGEYLVAQGLITEDQLLAALMVRHSLPGGPVLGGNEAIPPRLARLLPAHLASSGLFPVSVDNGILRLACTDLPADTTIERLRAQTRLLVEFHLTTSGELKALRERTDTILLSG